MSSQVIIVGGVILKLNDRTNLQLRSLTMMIRCLVGFLLGVDSILKECVMVLCG